MKHHCLDDDSTAIAENVFNDAIDVCVVVVRCFPLLFCYVLLCFSDE